MFYVGNILHGVKNNLPERAAPVVKDLVAQLELARDKCGKYEDRGGPWKVFKAGEEAVRSSHCTLVSAHACRMLHSWSLSHLLQCLLCTLALALLCLCHANQGTICCSVCIIHHVPHVYQTPLRKVQCTIYQQAPDVLQEKLAHIQGRVQQLLALLTTCAATELGLKTTSAVDELIKKVNQQNRNSKEMQKHLACMSDALKVMSDKSANAADVSARVYQLEITMVRMGDAAAAEVRRVCGEVQSEVSKDLSAEVKEAASGLKKSAEEMVAELEGLKVQMGMEFKKLFQAHAAEGDKTRAALKDVMLYCTGNIIEVRICITKQCPVIIGGCVSNTSVAAL